LVCTEIAEIIYARALSINDAADNFQLPALRMIKNMGHQGYLFLPIYAHFVIECLDTFNILQNEKHHYIKVRFLFIYK
jgi:hypothetical protein